MVTASLAFGEQNSARKAGMAHPSFVGCIVQFNVFFPPPPALSLAEREKHRQLLGLRSIDVYCRALSSERTSSTLSHKCPCVAKPFSLSLRERARVRGNKAL